MARAGAIATRGQNCDQTDGIGSLCIQFSIWSYPQCQKGSISIFLEQISLPSGGLVLEIMCMQQYIYHNFSTHYS